jgi:acetyl esterase/lipase
MLSFAAGWHVSELPMLTLATQLAATGRYLRRGRWKTAGGALRIAAQALSAAGLVALQRSAADSGRVLEDALVAGLGADYRNDALRAEVNPTDGAAISPWSALPSYISQRSRIRAKSIAYGPAGKRNELDIWAREDVRPGDGAPVLVQIHGGGWVIGDNRQQAFPLLDRLRSSGWVCVAPNYRLSPSATWPDHIVDVKKAIAWVKANIAGYGGDPDFVVITGGSAGGHLASLAALSANDPGFQPGFEDVDTSVRAAVPFYGVYDVTNWDVNGGYQDNTRWFAKTIMKTPVNEDPERWRRASPLNWVHPGAPPMMIVHGANDSLAPVEAARRIAEELGSVSRQPVVYAELPMAQHAFEVYSSLRTRHTVLAVERFLAYVRAHYVLGTGVHAGDSERSGA